MKKRLLSMLLIFTLVFTAVAPISAADSANGFAGGSGTENDPYLIATKAQLDQVRNDLTAHYKLTNDIVFTDDDFAATGDYYNNGTGWEPIGDSFSGRFDGNGYIIKGLYSCAGNDKIPYLGLFAWNEGTIINLALENSSISAQLSSSGSWAYAGGIAGVNTGNIERCYNNGKVSSEFYAGGISGLNFGTVKNCFNSGKITGEEIGHIGGLVGSNAGEIISCYNVGDVLIHNGQTGYFWIGGIAGSNNSLISNCYYLNTMNAGDGSGTNEAISCTIEEMKEKETFVGFDFETVWVMEGDSDYLYPELQSIPFRSPKVPVSVTIQTLPHKLTYTEGEEFDPAGLEISATFNNGTTEAVTDYTVTGYTSTPGIKTITVTYDGKSVSFEVEVLAAFSYSDVAKDAWYYESVQTARELGLMLGMSETTFEPDTTMSRAMMVTLLYRLAGSPSVNEPHPFTDTDANAWYADALNWAAANQLVNGTTPTTFDPDSPLTRAQMATLLYRYAQFSGQDVSARADLSAFPDSADVPVWALEAMQWAVAEEHIRGIYNNLVPQENTTRAQVATLLTRYIQH